MTKHAKTAPPDTSKLGAGRRRAPRVPASLACELIWPQKSMPGSLIDLSLLGAAVTIGSSLPLAAGDAMKVKLGEDELAIILDANLVSQNEESLGSFVARLRFDAGPTPAEFQVLVAECIEAFRASQAKVFAKHL